MKEVKAYQKKVEQAPQKLIEYLTAQGVEIAKMNVSDMNAYDSGELYNSIHAEQMYSNNIPAQFLIKTRNGKELWGGITFPLIER